MRTFVTVGSTKFDALVQKVFTDDVLAALRARGYTEVVVQVGNSTLSEGQDPATDQDSQIVEKSGVKVESWKFKPSLEEDYNKADLIISHAGSGTILDVLRRGKPMIVVPNPTLLHNHQQELADVLAERHYLVSSGIHNLAKTIERFDSSKLSPFPAFDGSLFSGILDETMGYV